MIVISAATHLLHSSQRRLLALRNRHLLYLDMVAFCLTPLLALALRLERLDVPDKYVVPLLIYTVAALVVRPAVSYAFGLYRRYWRYASVDDLVQITIAGLASTAVLAVFIFTFHGTLLGGFPRSLPFLDGLLAITASGVLRFLVRFAWQNGRTSGGDRTRRVVVLGAGDAGQMIVKEMLSHPQSGLDPVAFLDDDAHKRGVRIHGVPVIGGREQLVSAVRDHGAREAIIATPSAPGRTIRELVTLCEKAEVPVRTVPGIGEILDGSVSVSQVRRVQIEDLLRREPVRIDVSAVEAMLRGSRVLVTGAGGSIGSELCRQITRCMPDQLVLLGHGENSIFAIYNELAAMTNPESPGPDPVTRFVPVIADVRDLDRLQHLFATHRPGVVFHAAAHKHVPLMEYNVAEAVTNNVLGTANVLRVAADNAVHHVVLISTDKAVNPTNVMGATKRVAELLVQAGALRTGLAFVAVRFGNVLGSRGSVVPLFQQQIARGGPVTITHPDVRRYFMTIPEAVQLVLQAATLGQGGEVFVLDMGESVLIADLARDLIELSGLEVGRDIEIVYTGLRPGEKLFEELFLEGEEYGRTRHEKVFVSENGYATAEFFADLDRATARLIASARAGDEAQVQEILGEIVTEYEPGTGPCGKTAQKAGTARPDSPQRNSNKWETEPTFIS